jgi:nucleotide-binding universal stress UspA family protein
MKILCGTDFSPPALAAADAAAALAQRSGESLLLAHVVEDAWPAELSKAMRESLLAPQRRLLHAEAERLRRRGARVREKLLGGAPDEALAELARKARVDLVVISSLGRRSAARWLLGSVSERTVQNNPVPTLVVRSAGAWTPEAWAVRKPRILVGVDFTVPSDAALRWLGGFLRLGPCDVVAVHVFSPVRERERLGLVGVEDVPGLRAILERDVRDRVGQMTGLEEFRVRVEAGGARNDARLLEIAAEEQTDLMVVGTHQRRGLDRLWSGSVSRALLLNAPMSVVCVPVMEAAEISSSTPPSVGRVLAATDFSRLGNRALRHACSVVRPGGTVRFLHVVHPRALPGGAFHHGLAPDPRHERVLNVAHRRLLALVPPDAEARGLRVDVEVVEDREPARAICQAARRIGADVICLGTQGHTGLSNVVLGSVALAVLSGTHRPVLLVRPPKH